MKSGIDYFPLETQFEEAFSAEINQYGVKACGIIVFLLCKIYGEKGYYTVWNDEVASAFERTRSGAKAVSEVVNSLLRRGFFDIQKYKDYGILTSRNIQENYFNEVRRRKNIYAFSEYLCFDANKNFKNVCIISKNVDINSENVYIFENVDKEKNRNKESEKESEKEKRSKREKAKEKEKEKKKNKEITASVYDDGGKRAGAREGTPPPTKKEIQAYIREKSYKSMTAERFISYCMDRGGIPDAWRERLDAWEANDINKPKENHDSFDTKDFFEAALRKSYREMGCEKILDL